MAEHMTTLALLSLARMAFRASRPSMLGMVMSMRTRSGQTWVIDCAIDKDAMVHPMVPGSTPITDFLLD